MTRTSAARLRPDQRIFIEPSSLGVGGITPCRPSRIPKSATVAVVRSVARRRVSERGLTWTVIDLWTSEGRMDLTPQTMVALADG